MIKKYLILCVMGIIACTHLFADSSYTLKKTSAGTYELTSQDSLIGFIVYEEEYRMGFGNKFDKYAFLDSEGVPTLFSQSCYMLGVPTLKFSLSECDYIDAREPIGGKIWEIDAGYDQYVRVDSVIGSRHALIAISSDISSPGNRDVLTLTHINGDALVQIIKSSDSESWDITITDDNIIPLKIISIFGAFLDQTYLYWNELSGKNKKK